jgi:alpha-tubulin suppressor-like RCC1 family protein
VTVPCGAGAANNNGELGDGTTSSKTSPAQAGSSSNWSTLHASAFFNVGLQADGSMWAWGNNSQAQLGNGNTTTQTSPVQVAAAAAKVAVCAGNIHSFYIYADRLQFCGVGFNTTGQLGIGNTTNQTSFNCSTPLPVELVYFTASEENN